MRLIAIVFLACYVTTFLPLGSTGTSSGALIARWSFDDATPIGDLAFDNVATNNGNGGTINGISAASSTKIGTGAGNFGNQGASSGYFDMQTLGDFTSSVGHSAAFWYKAPASAKVADNRLPFHLTNGATTAFDVEFNDGKARAFARDSGSDFARAQGVTDIFDDTWHHVAAVYNATNQTAFIYIDGILDGSQQNLSVGGTFTFTAGRVGTHSTTPAIDIGGSMDDLGIWTETLNNQQIALIHGLGTFTGIDLANSGLASVLSAFNSQGSAIAGGYTWAYQPGLVTSSPKIGMIGGSIAGGNAFIVLDASGNGVQLVPEPGTLTLFGMALAGVFRLRHRTRRSG